MKHKLQTLLKHKLQWLLLLAALLGVSQGVWGNSKLIPSGNTIYFVDNDSWGACQMYYWYDDGNNYVSFTKITNTLIYYHDFDSDWWINGYKFRNNTSWSKQSSGDITGSISSDVYYAGTSTTANTDMTKLNGTAKFISKISTNGGTSYSKTANANCKAKISGKNLGGGNTSTTSVSNETGSSSEATIYPAYGSTVEYTGSASNGYTYMGCSTSNSSTLPAGASTSKQTVTSKALGTDLTTYYAYFKLNQYTATATVGNVAGGTVQVTGGSSSSTSSSATQNHGTSVTFSATASSGYDFVCWNTNADGSGTVKSTSTSYNITLTSATTLYAIFAASCTPPTKTQYTMTSGQSADYDDNAHKPTITKDSEAGDVIKIYGSTDNGTNWTDYGTAGPINAGTYKIKVNVAAGSTYCAANDIELDNTYTINQASRTISIDNTDVVCGAGTYTLLSTASPDDSGTKTYSISGTSSIASISGTTLTITGAGSFTVKVDIAASGNYAAASGTKEFTVTLPTLSTSAATSISYTSATLNGSVSDVTCTPSSSGFEYKKGSDDYTSVAAASATGSISKEISDLTPGTTYTFRTYTVVNGVTKYSDTRTFSTTSCSAPIIDSSSLGAQSKCKDASGTEMSVTASGGVGTLTYTWYKKNDTTPSGGTQVQSSTSNSYTPPTGTVGTLYYYCVVSSASPCASSTVNSGISGAVEIKAKPTLTKTPSTTHPYQPITFTSDMDADTSLENKGWDSTDDGTTSYFVSKGTRTAVYKRGLTTSARVWVIATNGCSSTQYFFVQTADTEDCTE